MVRLAILDGLVLSAAMATVLFAILRINPEMMLNDYPRDIRDKFGPISPRAKRQRTIASLVMLAVIVAVVAWSLQRLDARAGGDITMLIAFRHLLIVFMIFNIVDLILIDLPLVWMQPAYIVLPGTEGMEGYRNVRHHFIGFMWGALAIPPFCAGLAWLVARVM